MEAPDQPTTPPTTQWQNLTDLPPDVLSEIQSHLPPQTLATSQLVSRQFRDRALPVWEKAAKAVGGPPDGVPAKKWILMNPIRQIAVQPGWDYLQNLVKEHPELVEEKALPFATPTQVFGSLALAAVRDKTELTALDLSFDLYETTLFVARYYVVEDRLFLFNLQESGSWEAFSRSPGSAPIPSPIWVGQGVDKNWLRDQKLAFGSTPPVQAKSAWTPSRFSSLKRCAVDFRLPKGHATNAGSAGSSKTPHV